MGTVRHNPKEQWFYIDGILPLFNQVCSAGFTEISMDDLGAYVSKKSMEYQEAQMTNAVILGRKNRFEEAAKALNMALDDFKLVFPGLDKKYPPDQEYKEVEDIAQRINFHWHSHVNMGTFWSGEDNANASRLAKSSGSSWQIVLVGNKSNDYLVKFESHNPSFIVSGIPLEILDDSFNLEADRMKAIVKQKVFSSSSHAIDEKTDKIVERQKAFSALPSHYAQPGRRGEDYPMDDSDDWRNYAHTVQRWPSNETTHTTASQDPAVVSTIRGRIERFRRESKSQRHDGEYQV